MTSIKNKATILVVDDTPDNIHVLQGILINDYKLKVATSGAKALKILENSSSLPDLILLDIMMPEMDGYEVCRLLKKDERTKNIPVIFITAKTEVCDEAEGFKVGGVDYITKPVSPSIVVARVKTHLCLLQARQKLEKQNELLQENVCLREQVDRIMQHDLKAPLTGFLGIPNMLKDRDDLPADIVEIMQMLEKSAYVMLDMINKSFDLFKIECGTYEFKPVAVNLCEVISQIKREFRDILRRKKLLLSFHINNELFKEDHSFEQLGEETLFYSMFANLIKNAAEAAPKDSEIKVKLEKNPETVIDIHNQGVIPTKIRSRFMQKYATHGKARGTGLGAYSARLMAETMGGQVSFFSNEGEGTRIRIDFNQSA